MVTSLNYTKLSVALHYLRLASIRDIFSYVCHRYNSGPAPATFKWGGLTDSSRAGAPEAFCDCSGAYS